MAGNRARDLRGSQRLRLDRRERQSDDQLLKFTSDGEFVVQIGRANRSGGNTDTENVDRAADVYVYPATNELLVADR